MAFVPSQLAQAVYILCGVYGVCAVTIGSSGICTMWRLWRLCRHNWLKRNIYYGLQAGAPEGASQDVAFMAFVPSQLAQAEYILCGVYGVCAVTIGSSGIYIMWRFWRLWRHSCFF